MSHVILFVLMSSMDGYEHLCFLFSVYLQVSCGGDRGGSEYACGFTHGSRVVWGSGKTSVKTWQQVLFGKVL